MLTAHGRFDELLLYVEAGVRIVVHIRVRINVTTEGDVLCCGGSIMQHGSFSTLCSSISYVNLDIHIYICYIPLA